MIGCGGEGGAPGLGITHRMVCRDHQHDRVVGSIDGCYREGDRRPRVAADRFSKDVIGCDLRRALAHELHLACRDHNVGVVDGNEWRESLQRDRKWAAPMQER